MSWETQSWAAKQRPGKASGKLILLGLASCADANHCAYPSVQWLCDFSDLDRKTVITAVDRLVEAGLIEDTGERRGRTKQVKVYRLAVLRENGSSAVVSDPAGETVPETGQLKIKGPVFSCEESRKRDTEPFREPIPPTETIVSVCPPGQTKTVSSKGTGKGSTPATRLPDDWTPPEIEQLPADQRALVCKWPAGAYRVVAEAFRLHFTAESGWRGQRRDWDAAFGKWILNGHSRVMRDAKAGVVFAEMPGSGTPAEAALGEQVHPLRDSEGGTETAIRNRLSSAIGFRLYVHWFDPLGLIRVPDGDGEALKIVGTSDFALNLVREAHGDLIEGIARDVIGTGFTKTIYTVERVSNGSQGQQGQARGEQAGADDRGTAAARPGRGDGRDRRAVCA